MLEIAVYKRISDMSDAPHDNSSFTNTASPVPTSFSEGWTVVLVCLGVAIIAACVLIPQMDENGRLFHETRRLKTDLAHLHEQVAVNEDFLKRLGQDPVLAERVAQRQLNYVRPGSQTLDLPGEGRFVDSSPFVLTTVPKPESIGEFQPRGGKLMNWCRDARTRLYLMGAAMLMLAVGLVWGSNPASLDPADTPAA